MLRDLSTLPLSARRRREALLAWLLAACPWGVGIAAEPMSGLSAAFRPQALPPPAPAPAAPGSPAAAGTPAAANDEGAAPSGLRVLVTSPQRALASIDGRIVRVGDRINGMRVTRIDRQGVVLTKDDGGREQISITPSTVQRQNAAKPSPLPTGANR